MRRFREIGGTPPQPPDVAPPEPAPQPTAKDPGRQIPAFVDVVFDENDKRRFSVKLKKGLRQIGFGTLKELRSKASQFQDGDVVVDVRQNGRWIRCKANPFIGIGAKKEELVPA